MLMCRKEHSRKLGRGYIILHVYFQVQRSACQTYKWEKQDKKLN